MKVSPCVHQVTLGLFCFAWILVGLFGTGTEMRFQWLGFGMLGLAMTLGVVGSSGDIFTRRRLLVACLISVVAAMTYFAWRCYDAPVSYFGREDLALAGGWFITYAGTAFLFNRSRDRTIIFFTIGIVLLVNLGFVISQATFDATTWILPGYSRSYENRPGGVFNNPDHLAALFAASVPVLLSLALFDRGQNRSLLRAIYYLLAALLFFAVVLTKSRGGLLAASVGLAVWILLAIFQSRRNWPEYRKFVSGAALTIVPLVALGIAGLSKDVVNEPLGEQAHIVADTEANRPLIWQTAVTQHQEAPWLGTGSRSFYFFSRKFRSPGMRNSMSEAEFAHNEYLQVLADYGWVGLSFIGCVIFFHGVQTFSFLKNRHPSAPARGRRLALTIGAVAGLIALGVHAMIDFSLHAPIISMMSALLLGVLAVPGVREGERETPVENRSVVRPAMMSFVGASAALLFVAALKYGPTEWCYEKARLAFVNEVAGFDTRSLQQARLADPTNPFIHSLCGHFARRAGDLSKAQKHFADAAKQYPQDVFCRLAWAETLLQLERYEQAEFVLSIAAEWAPLYGNISQARGENAMAINDLAAAEAHFKAASIAPAFTDIHQARASLEAVIRQRRLGTEK